MSLNIKQLKPRHLRVLRGIAEGLRPVDVSREAGISQEHVSRIVRSDKGKAELLKLREDSEKIFAERLPELVRDAFNALWGELLVDGPRRQFALNLILGEGGIARPLLDAMLEDLAHTPAQGEPTREIIEAKSTTYGKETDNEHTNNQD